MAVSKKFLKEKAYFKLWNFSYIIWLDPDWFQQISFVITCYLYSRRENFVNDDNEKQSWKSIHRGIESHWILWKPYSGHFHHLQVIEGVIWHLLHFSDMSVSWRVYWIVMLLLGTQLWLLVPTAHISKLHVFLGPGDLMHSSGLGYQICRRWKYRYICYFLF